MKALVTGISGYLGAALTKRLIEMGHDVVGIARNESKLHDIKEMFPQVEIVSADISDPYIARRVVLGVDCIFHLAAHKVVGSAETYPKQCIQNNVSASMVLLQAIDQKKYDFIIATSTDKAAQVNSVYGATKLLMERLFKQFSESNPQTRYRITRYGNIAYSTSSVLVKWRDALQKGDEVIVTDMDATRFFWTVDSAVDLLFECIEKAVDASPYCPQMRAIRMQDLLDVMQEKYGKAKSIKTIGLQAGENKHELIISGGLTSFEAEKYTREEIYNLI